MRMPAPVKRAIAHAKPVVPADLWPLFRTLRSLRGSGPVIGLPAFHRALVLSAHPDDESLGCAGTIALLADCGASVTLLTATDGEATKGAPFPTDETARRRRAEIEQAAAVLGATSRSLGLADGALDERVSELAAVLRGTIAELGPDVVFVPWLLDGHPDHRAVADALAAAVANADDPLERLQVWGYETWTALVPNRIVDITSVIERKRGALNAHETAALAFDLSASEGLARWRSMQSLGGRGWAEAFLAFPAARYRELAARLRSP
jgi:LmbE family N-acetylglucosaminyl deacetylase